MKVRALTIGLVLLVGMSAAPTYAQSEGKFALGVDFSQRVPGDSSETDGKRSVGLHWRIGHGSPGWKWVYGLGWYSADVGRPLDGQNAEMGLLKVKPIMGGYGYTHIFGKNKLSADLRGGYAWTSIVQHEGFGNAYLERLGGQSVEVDASNTFVIRPGVTFWHDVSKKVGVSLSANYTVARPMITVRSSAGTDARRHNADMLALKVGVVYSVYPFK